MKLIWCIYSYINHPTPAALVAGNCSIQWLSGLRRRFMTWTVAILQAPQLRENVFHFEMDLSKYGDGSV
jgi:hypothetical protein